MSKALQMNKHDGNAAGETEQQKGLFFSFQESASPNELIHGESKAIYSLDVNESPKVTFQVGYVIRLRTYSQTEL